MPPGVMAVLPEVAVAPEVDSVPFWGPVAIDQVKVWPASLSPTLSRLRTSKLPPFCGRFSSVPAPMKVGAVLPTAVVKFSVTLSEMPLKLLPPTVVKVLPSMRTA